MAEQMTSGDDPGDFTVTQVQAFLDAGTDDPGEVSRILAAERAGQNRKGIVDAYVDPASAADEADEIEASRSDDHREDAEAMGYNLVDVTEAANNPPVEEV